MHVSLFSSFSVLVISFKRTLDKIGKFLIKILTRVNILAGYSY